MHPPFHTHSLLDSPTIAHGFFGREGGVSEGLYTGLNCGPGSRDNAAHIAENRARVAHALGMMPEKLCTLYQIHSPNVVIVHEPFVGTPPQADAHVTNVPGITLGILTADCAPVLFADVAAGVIGAAHAGWKGTHGGVVESTLVAMEKLGARRTNIAAVIGPCIAQASYEVGPEFVARFTADEQAQFFVPPPSGGRLGGGLMSHTSLHKPPPQPSPERGGGKMHFDLPAYVVTTAHAAGLQHVALLAMDTCSNEAQFFSYRRTTLAGEPDYGRQISAIALR